MANEQNLIPFSERTARERSEFGRKGAEASNKSKREKKTLANTINTLMDLPIQDDKTKDFLKTLGLEDEDLNNQTAMVVAMYKEALRGNVTAFNSLRDTSGNNYQDIKEEQEKMKEEIINPLVFIPGKDLGKAFVDINRWIDERKYNDIWFEGGRGSVKSSFISEKAIEILENNPRMCALVLRQVGNTLKDSVYSQMQWGIEQLSESYPQIKKHWKGTKSPLEIKNLNTGQIIYFRGADDPGKIKSIKPPKGMYIGLIIFEEFDQFKGMAEIRKIEQSAKRGGDDILSFKAYNTPRSNNHYVNKEKIIPKKGRYLHKSTYLDAPEEWLGQPFIDDANYLKEVAPKIYANEYLGEATGDGGSVFENIVLEEITDSMIKNFDYTYQGIDFGWFPDPLAWTKMCYQPDKKTLYIFDEYVVNKMSNEKVWKYLQDNKGVTKDDLITADSAEPKSIGDFQGYGSLMRGAKKGPDSVDYSMKWLSSLAKIVIDPKRCPKCAEEFTAYEYDTDKDGNYISKYIDANNHCIDSVRYATNPIWRRKGE